MSKREVTGAAILFTDSGVEVADCDVRRRVSAHADYNKFRLKRRDENYLLVGAATRPELITHAAKYTRTKFFRLMIDLQRLAQFEPIHPANKPLEYTYWADNPPRSDIDWDVSVAELDAQLYRKYGFTQAMIDFTEARYDDLQH